MDAIGIDAGSYKTVLGCVKKGGIEIVLSETSSKWTPSIAAFTDDERLIGDAAVNQMKKNFKNTLQYFSRFLGLNQDCVEQLEEEKKFITYKVVNLDNKKIGFEVVCRGETFQLTPEQVMAFFLRRSKTYFENAGMMSKEMVLSCPTYATNVERQAFLDAAEIAGIKCVKLINESTAIALNYGFFRKNDLDAKNYRTVCFVDFGSSKLTVSFAKFKQKKTKIIATHSDRNMGARQIDFLLFDLFAGEFAKKYGCDPRKSIRPRLRMLDTIEKCRKLLTLNKEADVSCESLMEDEDFHKSFKRDELEELITPFLGRFRKHMEEALAKSQLAPEMIDNIELVGDATRTPAIVEIIKEVMKKDKLDRTLNSTETIARGCALQAAMLSPTFNVSEFEIEEYNEHPIAIQYQFNGNDKVTEKELFKVGSTFPISKTITFDNKLGGANLLIKYPEDANTLKGLPMQIAQHQIPEGKKSEDKPIEKYSFIMRVANNIHNIAMLDEAEFAQEWTEEEKIPVKTMPAQPAPKKEGEEGKEGEAAPETTPPPAQEPQFEIKKKNKKTFQKLQFKTSNFALAPSMRKLFIEAEDKMQADDKSILDTKAMKNELETYCYNMREKCEAYGSLEKNIDPAVKDQFLKEIGETVDWLYEDGENTTIEEYNKRLTNFMTIGEPIKKRNFYWGELSAVLAQFEKVVEQTTAKLASEDLAHLTEEQRNKVQEKQMAAADFFGKVRTDREVKKDHEDPGFTLADLEAQTKTLIRETGAIFATPKPKPPAPEKTEEKKEDAEMKPEDKKEAEPKADAEMKDEAKPEAAQ